MTKTAIDKTIADALALAKGTQQSNTPSREVVQFAVERSLQGRGEIEQDNQPEASNDQGETLFITNTKELRAKIVDLSKQFQDLRFSFVPLTKEEDTAASGIDVPKYKIDTQYNFYTDYYEDITKNNVNIQEALLPNFYITTNRDPYRYKYIKTLNNEVKIDSVEQNTVYEYYDVLAGVYKNKLDTNNTALLQELTNMQKKIYYSKDTVNNFLIQNKKANLVPFENIIKFDLQSFSQFAGILDTSNFIDNFCEKMIQNMNTDFSNFTLIFATDNYVRNNDSLQAISRPEQALVSGIRFNTVTEFTDYVRNICINLQPNTELFTLEENSNQLEAADRYLYPNPSILNNRTTNLQNAINLVIFMNKLNTFLNSAKLTPQDFVNGNRLYSELFMYELNKRDVVGFSPQITRAVLQSAYFPAVNGISEIEFIDSQIKFNKTYYYDLQGIYFGLRQNIDIDWLAIDRDLQNTSQQDIENRWNSIVDTANLKNNSFSQLLNKIETDIGLTEQESRTFWSCLLESIIENNLQAFSYRPIIYKKPLLLDTMVAVDNPPPPPEVLIDGLMGIDDTIIINLMSSINEFKQVPVLIQPEDLEIFNRNKIRQKLSNLEQQMMFDGDDRIEHFQVFRIEKHPSSFNDFKDSFVEVSTTYVKETEGAIFEIPDVLKKNHATYADKIRPNIKYYYIFRSVDVHGNLSNPSPIYEVELVNSEGTIFPLIKIVDFNITDDKTPTKQVRRFLHISPNATQTLINETRTGYFNSDGTVKSSAMEVKNNVVLGLTDASIWNKKYRLKIRSKSTGKIIEIDFKFVHELKETNT